MYQLTANASMIAMANHQTPGQDDRPGKGFFDVGGLAGIVVDTGLTEVIVEDTGGECGSHESGTESAANHHHGQGEKQSDAEARPVEGAPHRSSCNGDRGVHVPVPIR